MQVIRAHSTVLEVICILASACASNSSFGATIALDDASHTAYADGWQTGDNGGTGFGPWTLAYTGVSSGLLHDPHFIDRGPQGGNSLGAPAFGLTTSDRDFFTDTSEAVRTLNASIRVGDTLSLDLDGSALESTGLLYSKGNTFQLIGSDNQERFGLFTNNGYNDNNWTTHSDVNTGVLAGSAFRVTFTLVTANSYDLAILPIGGGNPLFSQTGVALTGTLDAGITQLRISAYGTGSSTNGSKDLFFRNLMVSSQNALSGDYNADGTVDAADYVVWRKTGGTQAAYDTWRAHFGETAGSGSTAIESAAVPEPLMLTLLFTGILIWAGQRARQPRLQLSK
jgi:hypothetical protein